jgi:peptide/nickel transport system permease protein
MTRYLIQRLFWLVVTLWALSFLVFAGIRLIPGDTIDLILGTSSILSKEQEASLSAYYGLDRPMLVQYVNWLGAALRGDMGLSVRTGQPVMTEVLQRFPLTLELAIITLLIAVAVGTSLGIASALRANSAIDAFARLFSLVGMSVPNFVIAILTILILSVVFHWFPASRFVSLSENPAQNLKQLAFPAIALGMAMAAGVARMTRSSMLEVMREDYVRTARSKGLKEAPIILRHSLKNALIPVITLVGIDFGRLLGGTVIVEQIYALPGLGRLALYAIYQRDYAMVQASVLFIAACYVFMNLVADMAYAFVDPRIRYE